MAEPRWCCGPRPGQDSLCAGLALEEGRECAAVGGGFGTLSEIALALRTGVPVIGLATWSLQLDSGPVDAFPVADDAETAAHLAIDAARSFQTDPARKEPDV